MLWFSNVGLLIRVYVKGDFFEGQNQPDISFQVIQGSASAFPYAGDYVHPYEYKLCLTSSGHTWFWLAEYHTTPPLRPFWQWMAGVQRKVAC